MRSLSRKLLLSLSCLLVVSAFACSPGGSNTNTDVVEDTTGQDITPDAPDLLEDVDLVLPDVADVQEVDLTVADNDSEVPPLDVQDVDNVEPDIADIQPDENNCTMPCAEDDECVGAFPGESTFCMKERCLWDAGCNAFQCQLKRTPADCCDDDGDCADDNACTLNEACLSDHTCTFVWNEEDPACCINQSIRSLTFDDGLLPPTSKLQIVDHNPADVVTWSVQEDPCSSGMALYLGDPTCKTYYNGQMYNCQPVEDLDCTAANADLVCPTAQCNTVTGKCIPATLPGRIWADVVLPEVVIPADSLASVKFDLWIDTEPTSPGTPYLFDVLELKVEIGGVEQEVAFTSEEQKSTDGTCITFAADLSIYAGMAVDLKFSFDTNDGTNNFYKGIYLDNLVVSTYCTPCTGLAECEDLDVCTTDACVPFSNEEGGAGFCDNVKVDPYCWPCGEAADCTDHGPYPEDTFCWPGSCLTSGICSWEPNPSCCEEANLSDNFVDGFESGTLPAGYTVQGDGTLVGWTVRTGAGSPEAVSESDYDLFGLYYGNPATGTYDCGTNHCEGSVRTPSIDLGNVDPTAYVMLSFDLKLSTEFDAVDPEDYPEDNAHTTTIDVLYVEVVRENGAVVEVWNSDVVQGSTHGAFARMYADLSAFKSQEISLRYRFSTGDVSPANNGFGGVWVDEIKVESVCHSVCSADSQCGSEGECSVGVCQAGLCSTQLIEDCCTQNVNPSCNDGDSCTVDSCNFATQTCSHVFSSDPSCCTAYPAIYTMDFEGVDASSWTVPQSGATCGDGFCAETENCHTCQTDCLACPVAWRLTDLRANSGSQSLYFGNPEAFNYAYVNPQSGVAERTYGTIVSPAIQLPPFGIPAVSFNVWIDTEHTQAFESFVEPNEFDNLNLYVQTASSMTNPIWSAPVKIWTSMNWDLKGSTFDPLEQTPIWKNVSVGFNNTAYYGKVVRFQFVFDTVEATANDGEGAYVDDFTVFTMCDSNYECLSSVECAESTPLDPHCSMETCQSGVCGYDSNSLKDGCCEQEVLTGGSFDFDGPCTMENWAANPPSGVVRWQADNHQNHTAGGQCGLFFGNATTHTYNNPGFPVQGKVTSPAIDVSGYQKIEVGFWMWLDLEDPTYLSDILTIKADYAPTATMSPLGEEVTLWTKPCSPVVDSECQAFPVFAPCDELGCVELPYSQWAYYKLTLDFTQGEFLGWAWNQFPSQILFLVFDFNSWDEIANNGAGIYIDDVEFKTICQ